MKNQKTKMNSDAPHTIHRDDAMPLVEHLRELRHRLLHYGGVFIVCFLLALGWAQEIYDILAAPLAQSLQQQGRTATMIYTQLPEVFFAYVRVAFFVALCVSFPYGCYQLWQFIAPALYQKERRLVLPLLWMMPVLFAAGALFAYHVVLPLAWHFFSSFGGGESMAMRLEAKVSDYLSLSMALIFSFGASFLLPIFLVLLVRAKMVTLAQLIAWRRYAIVTAFLLAAILTPPDVISQILLAVPLILLYEASVVIIRLTKGKNHE